MWVKSSTPKNKIINPVALFVKNRGNFLFITKYNPIINNKIGKTKYQMPRKNRKIFTQLVGINPSLIIDAPLPNIDKNIKRMPSNSNCNCFVKRTLILRLFLAISFSPINKYNCYVKYVLNLVSVFP